MNTVALTTAAGMRPSTASLPNLSAELESSACCGSNMPHSRPMRPHQHVFRAGDAFSNFYIVRSGSYKIYTLDRQGQERVTGFRFAGEPLGLDAIFGGKHPSNAVALETSTVWIVPYSELRRLAASNGSVRTHLFQLMSRVLGEAATLAGDFTAEERVARFLVGMSQNFQQRGFSANRFNLSMSRRDIANHLRLAAETVTRVFTQFHQEALIRVDRRGMHLLDISRLQQRCAAMDMAAA